MKKNNNFRIFIIMNNKKLIKEIQKIKNCFGLNLLNESVGPGDKLILGALDASSTGLVKTLGTELATQIENSILTSVKNSELILNKMGKKIGDNVSFDDIKTLYGQTTKSSAAEMVLKELGSEGSKVLDDLLLNKINPKNLTALGSYVKQLDKTNQQALKTSLQDLQTQFSKSIDDEATFETACEVMEATIPKLKEQLKTIEMDQTLKVDLERVLDSFQTQINTHKFSKELSPSSTPQVKNVEPSIDDWPNMTFHEKPSYTPVNLKTYSTTFSNNSFDPELIDFNNIKFKEDAFPMEWIQRLIIQDAESIEKWGLKNWLETTIIRSIGAGLQLLKSIGLDMSPIEKEAAIRDAAELFPITGFEKFGTDNFRDFIIKKYKDNTLRINTSLPPSDLANFDPRWSSPFSWDFSIEPPTTNTKNQLNYNQLQNSQEIQKQLDKWDKWYDMPKEGDYNYKTWMDKQKKDMEDLKNKGFYNINTLPGMNESLNREINKIKKLL